MYAPWGRAGGASTLSLDRQDAPLLALCAVAKDPALEHRPGQLLMRDQYGRDREGAPDA